MNPADIVAAIAELEYDQVAQIRAAVDSRMETLKADFMAQAEAMGLACHYNGKPKRKRRANSSHKDSD